jgi:uncharacterized NAD(P)/FAD-binding protein YdhS
MVFAAETFRVDLVYILASRWSCGKPAIFCHQFDSTDSGVVARGSPAKSGNWRRRRLLRHLRAFWDTRRYRVAPQTECAVRTKLADGSLTVLAASLRAAAQSGGKMNVTLRPRGASPAHSVQLAVDTIIVTTGPAHGSITSQMPVLASLAAQGVLLADPLGLSIAVDPLGRAISADGQGNPRLYVAGLPAHEQYGELMGLPQVAGQASAIASEIAHVLAVANLALVSGLHAAHAG